MGLASLRQAQVKMRRSEECLTTSSQSPLDSSDDPDSVSETDLDRHGRRLKMASSSRTESANQLNYHFDTPTPTNSGEEPVWTRQQPALPSNESCPDFESFSQVFSMFF